ncbi:TMEM43 family protein [Dokdonella soli]|uniref:Uncharacterized protein n=1 Tax=Dokdonella soli TaxID=529810 RepID=A0ABN1IX46_9GAMM
MGRARRGSPSSLIVVLLVIAAFAGAAWFALQRKPHRQPAAATPAVSSPAAVAADRIDPANEGRNVIVSGTLRVAKPARDAQLGVSAEAVALLRQVEMLQWRETCTAKACDYALAWSATTVDSRAFREPAGHQNPAPLPFASERFLAGEVRLGAFVVDPVLAAEGSEAVAYPVHATQLPPNLAATFRERDGVLYTGTDHGAAGDLRVSYRVVAAGERRLSGVQVGNRLKAAPTH